jgi:hypothetical protein
MTGVSLMFFMQGLGGAVFISIAQVVFTHSLVKNLGEVSNISTAMIVHTGATELRDLVPAAALGKVLVAYNTALTDTIKVGVGCACLTIVVGLGWMEWKSVKGLKQGGGQPKMGEDAECKGEEGVTDADTVVETPPRTAQRETNEKDREG